MHKSSFRQKSRRGNVMHVLLIRVTQGVACFHSPFLLWEEGEMLDACMLRTAIVWQLPYVGYRVFPFFPFDKLIKRVVILLVFLHSRSPHRWTDHSRQEARDLSSSFDTSHGDYYLYTLYIYIYTYVSQNSPIESTHLRTSKCMIVQVSRF